MLSQRRRALVTGAASGMGKATCEVLLDHGWQVLALDRAEVGRDIEHRDLHSAIVDVTDRQSIGAAISDFGGHLDLVANIAGVYPPTTLADYDLARFRAIFDVNVLGLVNVTAEAMRLLGSGGAVVNFASVDAFDVSPGQLLYGASKAAVVMLTKSMALELAPAGIRVNGIAPGWVDTPGNAATGRMRQAAESIPLGRVAQPREIARWVELLAGPDAGFMTGETIVLSGGDVLR
ncbi:MAG: SDR family NAD(P)-dependent oxidoreductase [Actinomycetales bacterium]